MLEYKEVLSNRNKAETGIRYEWYAMQRWGAKYWEENFQLVIESVEIGLGDRLLAVRPVEGL